MYKLDPTHQCPVRYHQYVDGVLNYKEEILLKNNPTQHAVLIQSRHLSLFSQWYIRKKCVHSLTSHSSFSFPLP